MPQQPRSLAFAAPCALAFCTLIPLTGCVAVGGLIPTSPGTNVTGNWQIQSTVVPAAGSLPTAGLLLLGALSNSGSKVTGTFRFADLALPTSCGLPLSQIVSVTGSVDAAGNLALTSVPFNGSTLTVQLLVPPLATTYAAGTIAVNGGACAFPSSPAIAAEIASITGTFAGPVTALNVPVAPPILSGTATLTLIQSTIPAADGQFAVSGTLGFTGGGCISSTPVSGTVSGSLLSVASAQPLGVSYTHVTAFVPPAAVQITTADIFYSLGPCGTGGLALFSGYSGSLTKQ